MRYDFIDWVDIYMAKLPHLILALLVLLIGWIIAKAIGKSVEKFLRKQRLDERIFKHQPIPEGTSKGESARKTGRDVDKYELVGKIVYYILLVFVVMIFLQILNLGAIASPFMGMFGTMLNFVPAILKAAIILLVAYAVASFLRMLVNKVGTKPQLTRTLRRLNVIDDEVEGTKYTRTAGNIVFYLVMLLFIPAVLSALHIGGMAEPFRGMLDSMLAFIPKLLAAALIFLIGLVVARIIRDLVTGLLQSVGTERVASRIGFDRVLGEKTLSSVIGTIIFVFIMIPITISALDQLQIQAISLPAITMLNEVMIMIPNIIIATLLIIIAVWLGKWVRQIVGSILQRVGFDSLTRNMEIGNWKPASGRMAMSEFVGYIAQILVIFFLVIEALRLIKLGFLVTMLTAITAYLPMVLAAILILGIGLIVANVVANVLSNILTGPSFRILTAVAKYSIIAISIFMALDQLHIAATIVNSAFILILGGLALAFGLSFGLGGKEFASSYLKKLDHTIEQTNVNPSKTPENPVSGENTEENYSGKQQGEQIDEQTIKEYRDKGGPDDFLPPKK